MESSNQLHPGSGDADAYRSNIDNQALSDKGQPQAAVPEDTERFAVGQHPGFTQQAGEHAYLPQAALSNLGPRRHRRGLIALGAAGAVVAGGIGAGIAVLAGGDNHPVSKKNNLFPGQDDSTQATPSTVISPTSIPSTASLAPSTSTEVNGINLTAIIAGEEHKLAVSDADVPEYIANPLVDPQTRLNATLADYSYYISTQNDANAEVALQTMTSDPNTIASLEAARHFWQANKKGTMLWFWLNPSEQSSVNANDNGDGTVTVSTQETINFKAVTMPSGVWAAPPADFDKSGAAHMAGFSVTYGPSENGTQPTANTYPANITKASIGGVDNAGQPVIFPLNT